MKPLKRGVRRGGRVKAALSAAKKQRPQATPDDKSARITTVSIDKEEVGEPTNKFRRSSKALLSAKPSSSEKSSPRPQPCDAERRPRPGEKRAPLRRDSGELKKAIFVRNLPFDATPHAVAGVLSKFGGVERVFLVRNEAGECKGTAFVYFEKEEAVRRAAEASATYAKQLEILSSRQRKKVSRLLSANSKQELQQQLLQDGTDVAVASASASLFLNGRRLSLLPAVDRSEAQRMRETHHQTRALESSKTRGLGLAFFGLLRPGKKGFDALSENEQRIAKAAFEETRAKLKNPNFFVNKNRLCLRNLPPWVDANFLRERLALLLARIGRQQLLSPLAAKEAAAEAAAAEASFGREDSLESEGEGPVDADAEDGEDREAEGRHGRAAQKTAEEDGEKKRPRERGSAPQQAPSLKQLKAAASSAIEKVVVARARKEDEASSGKKSKRRDTDAPRRSLGFAFVSLKSDFAQTLALLLALRDVRGFFSRKVSFAEAAAALPQSRGGEGVFSGVPEKVDAAIAQAVAAGEKDAARRPLVQFALEDARKVKIMKERVATFAQLLKKREAEANEQDLSGAAKRRLKRKKTYSRGQRQREKRRRLRLEAEAQQQQQAAEANKTLQQLAGEALRGGAVSDSKQTRLRLRSGGGRGRREAQKEKEAKGLAPEPTPSSRGASPNRRRRKGSEADDERRELMEEEQLRKRIQQILLQKG